jgi:Tol biopolymer transport system component
VSQLQALVSSTSSADIGGPKDISLPRPVAEARRKDHIKQLSKRMPRRHYRPANESKTVRNLNLAMVCVAFCFVVIAMWNLFFVSSVTPGKIAYVYGYDTQSEVRVMNADGSKIIKLTSEPNDSVGSPVWSPNGKRVAFVGSERIYVSGADGSNIMKQPAYGSGPQWSPDSNKIIFGSDSDGSWQVYVMNADGTGPTKLTTEPGGIGCYDIAWSPDGKKVAFAWRREGSAGIGSTPAGICIMNADGSGQERLSYYLDDT